MKLKKLIIQGFKSFKDRTIVHFDDGITGIVGPNGCGKSNIVDALFWVMGEQSAKHLRGKSMKDLIFSGSSKYNPGAFAEATLILENDTGKHIHIGNKVSSPSEIQLTRKLYRNGETEYRINSIAARLRDIQEVFMDTGAGAKSYSIIAQGEINRLVQARPEERRVMIEEVAGITKFKARKRESLRKIEATQVNLSRLSDLQVEIEKNLRALQKQAEKAERARSLREKVKRNELIVSSHKVFEFLKSYREDSLEISELELEIEGEKLQRDHLEISLEDERHSKEEQTLKIEELQGEYNDISRSLAGAEERLHYLCKGLTEKEDLIDQRERESKEVCAEIEGRKERLKQIQIDLEKLEAQREERSDNLEEEELIEELKESLVLKEEGLNDRRESFQKVKEELNDIDQQVFKNTGRLEEFAGNIQDITAEIEGLEEQYSEVNKSIVHEREASLEAKNELDLLLEREREMKSSLEFAQGELHNLEGIVHGKRGELVQAESKLSSLIEINKSLEGAKEGNEKILKDSPHDFSLLGELIRCDDRYASGVQSLLRDFFDVIIARGSEGKEKIYSWSKSHQNLGVDALFLGSDSAVAEETVERLRLRFKSIVDVTEILDFDDILGEKLRPFLRGYYLVAESEFEKVKELSDDISFKGISSFDGKRVFRNEKGAFLLDVASENDRGEGVVERNNRISHLERIVEKLQREIPELEQRLSSQRSTLKENQLKYEQFRDELIEKKSETATLESSLELKLSNIQSGHSRLDILTKRKTEISKKRFELLEKEESLALKREELLELSEDLFSQVEESEESLSLLRDDYAQKRESFLERQLVAKSFDERRGSFESQMGDIHNQIERQEKRFNLLNDQVEKYKREIEEMEKDSHDLEEGNQEIAEDLKNREETLSLLKESFSQLLIGMQKREDEVKKRGRNINKAEKKALELEGRRLRFLEEEEQVVRDIFEKYRIDLREVIFSALDFSREDREGLTDISDLYIMETEEGPQEIEAEPYEFTRRYGQDLRDCEQKFKNCKLEFNRLGEVNWQAIEDYERQKLRFDFLSIQEAELKKSLEDLELAISHIDEKSKRRFKIAFEEVNTRFQKVFPLIFGGGSAELRVTGDIADFECGIEIIAQPPGKKMQNINLMSGGEKAMTAVSLIFSIFLVKPSPFCLLDEVDAPLDDANVGRFNELLREMSKESQFILITHNKKTMELNDTLYGVTMQEPGVSKAVSVQLH